jgi:RimJ/RimL family protein N-acetyltransferase
MRFPDDVPTLTAGDVTLRAHRREDVAAIVEQCTDPVSIRWTTVPPGYSAEMAEHWVTEDIPEAWTSGREWLFAIEATHADGRRRFGGSVSLRDEGDNRAELAFGAHPGVRGRGVTRTAVGLLLDWGFAEQGIETVVWLAHVGNVASRRIAWHAGFTFGGTMRRWLEQRGEYQDGWVATLHRDDPRGPTTRWLATPHLLGDRVALRPLVEEDVPAVVEGCSDPRTQHWLAFLPRPYAEADARDWLVRVAERASVGQGVWWAVVDPADGRFLASVSVPRLGHGEGEIGYWTHPAARGQGVMSAAVGMVVRHAFAPIGAGGMGLRRLTLHAASGNVASQQVARVNGFREYGRERSAELLGDGEYDDMVLFDLLATEWESR